MLISWANICVYLTRLWHLQGNEPHNYAYVFGAFLSYDISFHFVVVPLFCDLVVMPLWSMCFIVMPFLYNFGVVPLLCNFSAMSCPCFVISLSWCALAPQFCFYVLALQFSSRVCNFWFLYLLNMYLFRSPFEHCI